MKDYAHAKSPLLQDFCKKQRVLISYIRDEYGFKRGLVVATSEKNIGYSIVNLSQDVEWKRINPYQLPAVRKMIAEGKSIADIVHSTAFSKCINSNNAIRIPKFVLRTGMLIALDRAIKQEVQIIDSPFEKIIQCPRMPRDEELKRAILNMQERAKKYFKV